MAGRFREAVELAARAQAALSSYYGIETAPSVGDFVRPTDGREALYVRERDGELDVALDLPCVAPRDPDRFDTICQVVEGVSHFVLVAERARRELPTTQLELELQAEIDKFVLLVGAASSELRAFSGAAETRARLFASPSFLHEPGTEPGDRYRVAHRLGARVAAWLEARFLRAGRLAEMREVLVRFYGAGQAEKIAFAAAA